MNNDSWCVHHTKLSNDLRRPGIQFMSCIDVGPLNYCFTEYIFQKTLWLHTHYNVSGVKTAFK